jgi:hypothetical protein
MTREVTIDKIFLAAADESYMEKQRQRIEHLENAICRHRAQVQFSGASEGRNVDRELWDAMGNTWEVDDE